AVQPVGERKHGLALVQIGLVEPQNEIGPSGIAADQFFRWTWPDMHPGQGRIGSNFVQVIDDAPLSLPVKAAASDPQSGSDTVEHNARYGPLVEFYKVQIGGRDAGASRQFALGDTVLLAERPDLQTGEIPGHAHPSLACLM